MNPTPPSTELSAEASCTPEIEALALGPSLLPPGAAVREGRFFDRIRSAPPSIRICLALMLILAIAAVAAPWVAPFDPNRTNVLQRNDPPSWLGGKSGHLLGTDQLGRDVLSRCIYALRVSVGIALLGVAIGCTIGVLTGVMSGLIGGWTDRIIMMIVDFQLSIPFLLIVLVGIAVFGTSMAVLIVLVGTAHWETYARLTRGQVLTVREFQFVEAAVALGATTLRIARRHVLPNIASPIIVLVTLNFPSILLLESSLSFLGIGVQPPTASLGRMVGEGRDYMMSAWWLVMSPAAFIVLVTLCMQLIGDWLRDVIDVRLT
ncbi:MAG: ABC transporter permease [Desulfobacterales bacterium]|jgi:peptide/nickel transport system permease protein|nr:ABC transporter permease [Desulfobacterales bacterium]